MTLRERLLTSVDPLSSDSKRPHIANKEHLIMGANHAGERKRKKLKNTKKIIATQEKKAKAK